MTGIPRRVAYLSIIVVLAAAVAAPAQEAQQGKAARIDELLRAYNDYGRLNGAALVAEDGEVIHKAGYGLADMEWSVPNGPDTRFRIGSLTKQFTAMLVMQLVEEGRLSLEGRLSDYLPYYRSDTGGSVTIHHLLTHTSGIPSYTGLPDFDATISKMDCEVREFVEQFCSGDLEFEPGSDFRYSNSGYFILGAVIEEATGRP